ncbi:Uncharacterized protein HZ326_8459 [Fusarium oxysporum f. sp. albedinis]|nr:Uncharacterized protein HZ326_8459 [Fusarium oxysporum f. sp. albedinis]
MNQESFEGKCRFMLSMGRVSWTGLELCRASTDVSLFQHLVVVGFKFIQDKVCRMWCWLQPYTFLDINA